MYQSNCKCTSKIKLEIGKIYLTELYNKVKIVGVATDGKYLGESLTSHYSENIGCITRFHLNGKTTYEAQRSGGYCTSLVSEYHEPEYWYVNVYKDQGFVKSSLFRTNSRQEADALVYPDRIALVKINRKTGEASNEKI
jgi:hypothetical protein